MCFLLMRTTGQVKAGEGQQTHAASSQIDADILVLNKTRAGHRRGGSTGSKVTIGQSRADILLYGSSGFAAVPQLFYNESVLYVFFAVSNVSSSTVVPGA